MKEKTRAAKSVITQRTSLVARNETALTVLGNPMRVDFADFERELEALKTLHAHEVSIDLTKCTYASSLFIGALVEGVTSLKSSGRTVKVRVSPELGRFLNMARLFHLFEYEIVGTEA
jgi:anti-anti-sigma regulatory factor